jgi:hypothetical protein
MQSQIATHAQELFEELQITASTFSLDSDGCALTSICGVPAVPRSRLLLEEQHSQVQFNWEGEMAKLLEMAASMRLASRSTRFKKNTRPSIKTDLPPPVRFGRAIRKRAAAKGL